MQIKQESILEGCVPTVAVAFTTAPSTPPPFLDALPPGNSTPWILPWLPTLGYPTPPDTLPP